MSAPTGIVRDPRFLNHDMGEYHVENPRRVATVYRMLDKDPIPGCTTVEPRPATEEELSYIHMPSYIRMVKETAGRKRVVLDPDTSTSPLSYETALLAAGGLLRAADLILEGTLQNAFALVRPPGHHAESDQARGFCIFNNIAVAAEHLVRTRGLRRVLVVDWDLHHGNGTQHAFYARKDVLYFSTHQFPYYPGTGFWNETGVGEGEGYTVNVPLSPGKGDEDFLYIYKNILGSIVSEFQPEFLLVSAGFDIYGGDPLGGMDVTREGFGALAAALLDMAKTYSGGKILFALEGGYNLEGLREGIREVLLQMTGAGAQPALTPSSRVEGEIGPALAHIRNYWKIP